MLKKGTHDAPGLEGVPILILSIPVVHAIVLHDSPTMCLHRHRHPSASYSHLIMQILRQQEVKEIMIGIHAKLPSVQKVKFQSQVCPATVRHAQCSAGGLQMLHAGRRS